MTSNIWHFDNNIIFLKYYERKVYIRSVNRIFQKKFALKFLFCCEKIS